MNYNEIIDQVLPLVREVGDYMKTHFRKVKPEDVETKSLNSLVSIVDKTAEKMLVDGLSKILPQSGFLTEEDTINDTEKEYVWIIDPLDGTTNYLYGLPIFSISVALQKGDEIVIGIVKEVITDETFTAIKGQGAYANGEKISVSNTDLASSVIATGFPYTTDFPIQEHFNIIKHWLMNARGVRRYGSAAIDLVWVAAGRFGAYYESHLNPWDVAAGGLIVQEAGGKVVDFNGGQEWINGEIIAGSPTIFDEVVDVVISNLP